MALFRRPKRARRTDEPLDPPADGVDETGEDLDDDLDEEQPAVPGRPEGPWDVDDVPDGGPERIDLGGLRVPLNEEAEVRIEMSPEGQVVAATVVRGASSMQVQAFAAPRSEGIWPQVRQEISAALASGGGQAQETTGRFGAELRAQVPAQAPDGSAVLTAARFVGVDGPRWFLRAMLSGPAAQDDAAAAALLDDLSDVVVVRGAEAMVVRDMLPLRLPRDVQAAADQAAAGQAAADQTAVGQAAADQTAGDQTAGDQTAGDQTAAGQTAAGQTGQSASGTGRAAPTLPERGPEITEIR